MEIRDDNGWRFPFLARQINGPIAKCFGLGIDSVYEKDKPFINFLSNFRLVHESGKPSPLYGEWLDMLGKVIGFPRPWETRPTIWEAFKFDVLDRLLPEENAFCGLDDGGHPDSPGGLLDSYPRGSSEVVEPFTDELYRLFLNALCALKNERSVDGICSVMEVITGKDLYAVSFIDQDLMEYPKNDIKVSVDMTMENYADALQNAFDMIFTTAPKVHVEVELDFAVIYIKSEIERIVAGVLEDDEPPYGFTVSNPDYSQMGVVKFTVTLEAEYADRKADVEKAIADVYGNSKSVSVFVEV